MNLLIVRILTGFGTMNPENRLSIVKADEVTIEAIWTFGVKETSSIPI